jgi:hypothetical protein
MSNDGEGYFSAQAVSQRWKVVKRRGAGLCVESYGTGERAQGPRGSNEVKAREFPSGVPLLLIAPSFAIVSTIDAVRSPSMMSRETGSASRDLAKPTVATNEGECETVGRLLLTRWPSGMLGLGAWDCIVLLGIWLALLNRCGPLLSSTNHLIAQLLTLAWSDTHRPSAHTAT